MKDIQHISPSTAEELTQILWDTLPRPSPLWNTTRKKANKFQGLPDILGARGKEEEAIKELSLDAELPINTVQLQTQPKVSTSLGTSAIENNKRKHSRVSYDEGYSWSNYIKNLCERGMLSWALQAIYKSNPKGIQLENSLYWLLRYCAIKKDLAIGREVHSFIIRKGLQSNSYIAFHLIRMFAMCDSLLEANQIFSGLPEADGFAWTAMISAYANMGGEKDALKLYEQMLHSSSVKPGTHVIVATLKACSSIVSLRHGMMVHTDAIREGFELDPFVGTMLIGMYARCGCLKEAHKVFAIVPKGNDDVAFSAMMTAYKAHGNDVESLEVFGLMQNAGIEPNNIVPLVCAAKACSNLAAMNDGKLVHCIVTEKGAESNIYAGSALIDMYVKCGCINEACNLFDRLPEKNEVTWSSMVSAFAEANDFGLALTYFEGMQKSGIKPNSVTFIAILSACSRSGMFLKGLEHFNSMWGEQSLVAPIGGHYNCLIDLLGRAGYVLEAEDLLHTMPFQPDVVGCMALLSHSKTHGNIEVGRTCFHHYVKMDLQDASSFLLMTDIYSDCGMVADAEMTEKWRKNACAFKKAGQASIWIDNKVHTFNVGGERGHQNEMDILAKLANVSAQLKMKGHFPFLD